MASVNLTPTDVTGGNPKGLRQSDKSEGVASPEAVTAAPMETSAAAPSVEEDPKLSSKYAVLARREKAFRNRIREVEAREKALQAKEQEYASAYVPKSQIAERFQKDPLGAMNEFGLSYEQITQAQLDPAMSHIQRLESKIQQLEEAQQKTTSSLSEQQDQAYKQAVTQIRTEAKLLTDSDERFETVKEMQAVDAAVELVEQTFKEQGLLLSVEEALQEVENHLVEEGLRIAKLKKIQQKLMPQEITSEVAPELKQKLPETKPSLPSQQSPLKTLTNASTVSTSKPLNPRERRERAILAFKGQLQT